MKLRHLLTVTRLATFLGACGGGGVDGGDAGVPASPLPAVSTDTFQIKTAYINDFNDTSSHPFTVSGTAAGFVVTGSGTVTQSPVTNSPFKGTTTLTLTY